MLTTFSGKQIQDCKALVTVLNFADKDDLLSQIQEYIDRINDGRHGAVNVCPVCNYEKTEPYGCKSRRCPACDHQWVVGWTEIQKFGRSK